MVREPEPRIDHRDLRTTLEGAGFSRRGDDSIARLAEASGLSTRTVYRALDPKLDREPATLDTADRLLVAAGRHLSCCDAIWPDGEPAAEEL